MRKPIRLGPALAAVLLAVVLLPGAAAAQRVTIDITGATFRPYPLAIPRVQAEGDAAAQVADEVTERLRYDLEVSGLFQVLDPRSFLAGPDEGLTAATIRFDDWANVGAEGLLKGRITVADGQASYEARLFNVARANEAARWTFSAPVDQARALAHEAANAIVRHFTGQRGIFDTRIAFVRRAKGGDKEVWVSDWDGHAPRRLVPGELNLLPAWHPSGSLVGYTTWRGGDPDLWQVDMDGAAKPLVSGNPMYTGGVWSPDGSKIAYTRTIDGNAEIFLADANGRNARRLTNSYGVDTSPSWSPDGTKIAFVSARHGNPHIFVMNADGSAQRRVTFQGNYNQTPDWSPRGDVIAFTARDERKVFDLFTVDPETGEITRLTQDTGNNEEPSFSPDGHHIVFTSTRTGTSRLWIMNADGTNQRMLDVPPAEYMTPAWGPWPAAPEAAPTAGSEGAGGGAEAAAGGTTGASGVTPPRAAGASAPGAASGGGEN